MIVVPDTDIDVRRNIGRYVSPMVPAMRAAIMSAPAPIMIHCFGGALKKNGFFRTPSMYSLAWRRRRKSRCFLSIETNLNDDSRKQRVDSRDDFVVTGADDCCDVFGGDCIH